MSERPSRARATDPMSFFSLNNLYTIIESEGRSQTRSQRMSDIDEERSSTRSSALTALPRWESLRNPRRLKIHIPVPVIPKRAHVRKNSQAPILENDALTKEVGSAPVHRSDSQRSGGRSGASTPAKEEQPRHSRMMIWLVLVVVLVLALAIILGAVLGTFVSPSHPGPEPSITEIPAGTTPSPTAVGGGDAQTPAPTPHLASLAVTGWTVPGSLGYFSLWLFWQSGQGYLSRATFNSSTGNWTRVTNFAEAKESTPLAATALNAEWYAGQENYSFTGTHFQAGVIYIDEENYLNEWIFPDSGPEMGQPGPLTGQKYISLAQTKIGSYWPQTVYQGMSGEIRQAHYECHQKNECWHEQVLSTTDAMNGTQLVVVPMGNNLSSLGLFYEQDDGALVNYKESASGDSEVWTNSAFPRSGSSASTVAAFSSTRSSDPSDGGVNTYLLWQDNNGTIQMSWTENNGGWRGPVTHPALAGATNNTALTCLTGLTFSAHPLPTGTELARCYFQAGLTVREVSFDGTSWDVVGVVPIQF